MTATVIPSVPPGRAGRLWLRDRIVLATRGVDLLDRKLRILRGEAERYALAVRSSRRRWDDACAEADRWLVRAVVLAGRRGLRSAADPRLADADIAAGGVMGLSYPDGAVCRLPEPCPAPGSAAAGSAALDEATRAYRAAVVAAVEHAAAEAALAALHAELALTRRRLRAVRTRWLPALEQALRGVEAGLDEQELEDGGRLRRFAAPAAGGRSS